MQAKEEASEGYWEGYRRVCDIDEDMFRNREE